MATDVPWRDDVLDKPLPVRNGIFAFSSEPGLGFDLVEKELEKHPGVTQRRPGFYV